MEGITTELDFIYIAKDGCKFVRMEDAIKHNKRK